MPGLSQDQPRSLVPPAKAWLCGIFVSLLWLPALDWVLHLDNTTRVNEKRLPAQFPAFEPSLPGLRHFLAGLEDYYNDNFGFRKRLIYWAQVCRHSVLREARQSKVIVGQKGWLYYASPGEPKVEIPGYNVPFTAEQLADWQTLLEERREWLARRGIAYAFLVPPDKQSVYPEYLPAATAGSTRASKLDQFVEHMKARSTVEVIDLRPALIAAKSAGQIYYRTDTHWNQYGAYLAYRELMARLAKQLPRLAPIPLDGFELSLTQRPGGNLAEMLAQAQTMPELDFPVLEPRPPRQAVPITATRTSTGAELFTAENPGQRGRAIIFGDSFGNALLPFLAQHFERVTLCRLYDHKQFETRARYAHVWDPDMIERQKPELVIDEITESLLCVEEPGFIRGEDRLRSGVSQ